MGIRSDDPQIHDEHDGRPRQLRLTTTPVARTRSCVLCEAYGDGYTAGKEKAYFEVRNWHPKEHAPSCGCNACMAARSVIEKLTG